MDIYFVKLVFDHADGKYEQIDLFTTLERAKSYAQALQNQHQCSKNIYKATIAGMTEVT